MTSPAGVRAAPRATGRVDVLAAIAVGGAIGSLLRHAVTVVAPATAGRFPTATLVVNLLGSFVLGVVLVVLTERLPPSRYARAFLAVGVIGAFTTFSSFAVQTVDLARDHQPATAGAFVVASVVGGLVAARLGVVVGRVRRHPPSLSHTLEDLK